MLRRFRVEESEDNVRVPVKVIRKATEAIFKICGLTVGYHYNDNENSYVFLV